MRSKLIESRTTQWGLLVSFVAIFALISGLYFPGCSDNPAASTDQSLSQDEVSFFELPFDESALEKKITDGTVAVDIILGEGLVTVEDGAVIEVGSKHLFSVAASAILTNTVVSVEITRLEEDGSVNMIYEFGPDGLVFSFPAILQLDAKKLFDRTIKSVELYYLNEETNLWECEGTFPVLLDGYAYIPVYHFSKYGVGR